jgi:hypothetical protein
VTSQGGSTTDADGAPAFSVISGNPTAAELAALTAVLSVAIEEANAQGDRTEERNRSAWQLAQRPIRLPLARGNGAWRSFSG